MPYHAASSLKRELCVLLLLFGRVYGLCLHGGKWRRG